MNRAKQIYNFLICCTKNAVEYYGKKTLHGRPFEGWPNRARPSKPFLPKWIEWLCPVRSALKRTSVQDLNSFSIMIYCIISTTYLKIWRHILPCYISGRKNVWIHLKFKTEVGFQASISYGSFFTLCSCTFFSSTSQWSQTLYDVFLTFLSTQFNFCQKMVGRVHILFSSKSKQQLRIVLFF